MSSIVVDPVEDSIVDTTEVQSVEEVTAVEEVAEQAPEEASATTETVEDTPSEVPDKFAGKEVQDIIDSYTNLEKELGRKSQEIGELRKLSDSFLQAEVTRNRNENNLQANTSNTEEAEGADFYDDPSKAVNSLIEKHPKFQEFQKFQQEQTQTASKAQLEQSHPDYVDIVKDTKFQDWVQGSKFRTDLFQQADSYNFDAANELLTHWKERSMIDKTNEVKAAAENTRKKALKTATSETRAATDSVGGKPTFRRADLIRLKMTDPARYEAMQDEIYQAYADKRVT
jgi:pterin-4a-carbinolamine dehydratase